MAKRKPSRPMSDDASPDAAAEPSPAAEAPPKKRLAAKASASTESVPPSPQQADHAARRFLVGEDGPRIERKTADDDWLGALNAQQRAAATFGMDPLLVVAGAGTGKTTTLVHRVAHLIRSGIPAPRILLLTFSRRAANEMLRRVDDLLDSLPASGRGGGRVSGGTFHATAMQLLRRYGAAIGLPQSFTILDRGDTEDLLNLVRTDLGVAGKDKRFPQKGTCLDIHSRVVNSRRPLEELVVGDYPWCEPYTDGLRTLFQGFVERKLDMAALDYDDLLQAWNVLLAHPEGGDLVRARYDCVLVDEFQDTNTLQMEILKRLRPDGRGLTVVGDDAQSIYSFRAATVRNILDFPKNFPGAVALPLEQNYRSTPQILAASNAVIEQAAERHEKKLWSDRPPAGLPRLAACDDEAEQADYVVNEILSLREEGIPLAKQAVLFRASFHSLLLETELARRNVPFVKFGGMKFLEAAHIKDLLAFLRMVENPRDRVSAQRALLLLPGVGPKKAAKLLDDLAAAQGAFTLAWKSEATPAAKAKGKANSRAKEPTEPAHLAAAKKKVDAPAGPAEVWERFLKLVGALQVAHEEDVAGQVYLVREFYTPICREKYDHSQPRLADLEQLERMAARFPTRGDFLADLTLDPPTSTADFADGVDEDEDKLTLSTIHSAKGLEWKAVYVIHAYDGGIPSEMAAGKPEQLEEERRLFYVALTRAVDRLTVVYPQRWFQRFGPEGGFQLGKVSRFLKSPAAEHFLKTGPASRGAPRRPNDLFKSPSNWRDEMRKTWR